MQEQFANATLGDIVAQNYRAAQVFERYGLDYCCGGRTSLASACRERGVSVEKVSADLATLTASSADVTPEDPRDLIAHIVDRHHAYVRRAIPSIQQHLAKVTSAHGRSHRELYRIAELFDDLAREFFVHLSKEEHVLFPYIRALAGTATEEGSPPADVFGTVQNPIRMMELEHQHAGDELAGIRSLASGYVPPADACATYKLVYRELEEFERDLHHHVHLENNVLFPQAIALEAQLERGGKLRCQTVK